MAGVVFGLPSPIFFLRRGVFMDSTVVNFLKSWVSDSGYVLVWTLPDKVSHWVKADDLDSLAGKVEGLVEGHNVYIGAGLSSVAYDHRSRCLAENIAGIVGLWLDVDILSAAHKKKNLPPTVEDALGIVRSLGVEPSCIINSGNGLQAWWFFREPWLFDTPAERQNAASLAAAFNGSFRIKAAELGWDVDVTHDLARVMRVPGTKNYNSDPPKAVHVISESGARYNPSDLEDRVIDRDFVKSQKVSGLVNFVLNPAAIPPFEKFNALLANNSKFVATWNRDRTDLTDQSPSTYDMSLALMAIAASWEDQEVVDLLIAGRRNHGDDLKLREDYYARTVARARQSVNDRARDDDMQDLVIRSKAALLTGTPLERETVRQESLKAISKNLQVNILRILKYLSDPPEYRIQTSKGWVTIGGSADLISLTIMRSRIFAASGILIPRFKPAKWDHIVQLMGDCCDEESAGAEATESGAVEVWLSDYLGGRRPVADVDKAVAENAPYVADGRIYVFGGDFRKYLNLVQMEKITNKSMGVMLRSHGCTPSPLQATIDGRRTSRSVWKLPQEYSVHIPVS